MVTKPFKKLIKKEKENKVNQSIIEKISDRRPGLPHELIRKMKKANTKGEVKTLLRNHLRANPDLKEN